MSDTENWDSDWDSDEEETFRIVDSHDNVVAEVSSETLAEDLHVSEDTLRADSLTEDTLRADSLTEDTLRADSLTEDTADVVTVSDTHDTQGIGRKILASAAQAVPTDKPEFGIWKYGRFGPQGDSFATESTGPQVSYINQRLGIQGDTYTQETFDAVLVYQRENRLNQTGRVDKQTYGLL